MRFDNKKHKASYWSIIAILFLAFALVKVFGWGDTIRDTARIVLSPITSSAYYVRNIFMNKEECGDEQKFLKDRVADLETEIVKYRELEKENISLREQLGVESMQQRDLILARVIGERPNSVSKVRLVDKGGEDAIKAQMPVVVKDALVGYISKVYNNSSEMILLTDPQSVLRSYVERSNSEGIIKGSFGMGRLTLSQINRQDDVIIGDYVLTEGSDLGLIKGILVGRITSEITEDRDPYRSFVIEPVIDLNKLDFVYVIRE